MCVHMSPAVLCNISSICGFLEVMGYVVMGPVWDCFLSRALIVIEIMPKINLF